MPLSINGSQRAAVIASVIDAVPAARDGLVFAAGSMVDGVANENSDLDLYVVGSSAVIGTDTTERKLEKNGTIGVVQGRELNVSTLDPRGLEELKVSYHRCIASLDGDRGIAQLDSENDLKVLHRVRTGEPLIGADRLETLRKSLICERLAEYMGNLHAVTAINRLTDVEGELAAGQTESAAWMFREALVHSAQLLLALGGETNPSRKWLLRMLLRGVERDELRGRMASLLSSAAPQLVREIPKVREEVRARIVGADSIGSFAKRMATAKLG